MELFCCAQWLFPDSRVFNTVLTVVGLLSENGLPFVLNVDAFEACQLEGSGC